MLNDVIQAERLLQISTPLGADALLMEGLEGTEMVNGLFAFTVAVRAKRDDIRAEEIVGFWIGPEEPTLFADRTFSKCIEMPIRATCASKGKVHPRSHK